ncbi:MAG: hypothetical protein J1E03_08540 [Acetatifactor sp.]|nr:hypothetical protein [Acetatifactor sp.]
MLQRTKHKKYYVAARRNALGQGISSRWWYVEGHIEEFVRDREILLYADYLVIRGKWKETVAFVQ